MAQILVPIADQATGTWSATPLWSKVDDDSTVNPSGDATTITSDTNTSPDNADLQLATGEDPSQSVNHTLRARWNKSASGGHVINAVLELWEGIPGTGTLRATLTVNGIGEIEVESTYTLSGAETDSITNYSNLYLRVSRQGDTGGPGGSRRSLVVDLVEFQVPSAVQVVNPSLLNISPSLFSPQVLGGFQEVTPPLLPTTPTFFEPSIEGGLITEQFARPISDITVGLWDPSTGTTLWEMIDEATPNDDTDYITLLSSESSSCRVGLSSVTDPENLEAHTMRLRMESAATWDISAKLINQTSGNIVATWAISQSTSGWETLTRLLSEAEIGAIENYGDLSFEISAAVLIGSDELRVSQFEFEVPAAVTGDQISPDLLDATPTLFSPTVTADAVVEPPLLDATSTLFAPEIQQASAQSIEPPLLTTIPTLFSPSVNLGVATPLLSTSPTLHQPTLHQTLSVPLIDGTPSFFQPVLHQTLQLALLSASPALFSATLQTQIAVPLLSVPPTLFSPSIALGVDGQFLDVTPTLFSPTVTVDVEVTPPLLSTIPTLFTPIVTSGTVIQVPLLDTTATTTAPALHHTLTAPLLSVLVTTLAPVITAERLVDPPLLTTTPTLFAPTVDSAVRVEPPLLTATPMLFAPSIPQVAKPDADISNTGGWTTEPLWEKIDETAPDDVDFISADGSSRKICEVSLSDVLTPDDNNNHILKVRARLSNDDATSVFIQFSLFHNGFSTGNFIEELQPGDDWVTFEVEIDPFTVGSDITDYTALSVELRHNTFEASTINRTDVSFVQFQVPESPNDAEPPLLSTTPTLFAPTVTSDIGAPLLTVSPTFFSPTIIDDKILSFPLLITTPSLFDPFLNDYLDTTYVVTHPITTYQFSNLHTEPQTTPTVYTMALDPGTYSTDPHDPTYTLIPSHSRTYSTVPSRPTYTIHDPII